MTRAARRRDGPPVRCPECKGTIQLSGYSRTTYTGRCLCTDRAWLLRARAQDPEDQAGDQDVQVTGELVDRLPTGETCKACKAPLDALDLVLARRGTCWPCHHATASQKPIHKDRPGTTSKGYP